MGAKQDFHLGDRVKVRKTLLFNDRVGVLEPKSSDPEDFWDFTVRLEPLAEISKPWHKRERIGVTVDQIERIS